MEFEWWSNAYKGEYEDALWQINCVIGWIKEICFDVKDDELDTQHVEKLLPTAFALWKEHKKNGF
jgi:hypothetical protein